MRSNLNGRRPLRRFGEAAGLLAVLSAAVPAVGQAAFKDLENQVVQFELANGLRFLVVERHVAPVFSYVTYVDAGGVDEVPGITGIAHMFEHMAFKGTKMIGTKDAAKEEALFEKMDRAWDAYLDEKRKGPRADEARLETLLADFQEIQDEAQELVIQNDFSRILEENGVVGLNAATSLDWTRYNYSLPSNRLELWAMLEGDRLTQPVLREFYKERDVVIEERRMGSESSPIGRLFNSWLGIAFPAHPYGNGVIGHRSDLETFNRTDAQAFRDKYYVASNMVIAVVGDVYADEVKKLAKKYFSDVPSGPEPSRVDTVEPTQPGERRLTIEDPAQPFIIVGYPMPELRHPDFTAYELLSGVLGDGRASRLYTRLVKEKRLAAEAETAAGFPGRKYANQFTVFALVSAGEDPYAAEREIYSVVERLDESPITDDELQRAKTKERASLIRQMRSNQGLAMQLAAYDRLFGDWHELFRLEERLDAVTAADLARIAAETFKKSNRNVAMMVNPAES
jgi:predicted Zn-dependent peptidase